MSKRAQTTPPSIRRYVTLRGGPQDGHSYIDVFVPAVHDTSGVFRALPFVYVGPMGDGDYAKYEYRPGEAAGFHVNLDGRVLYDYIGMVDRAGE